MIAQTRTRSFEIDTLYTVEEGIPVQRIQGTLTISGSKTAPVAATLNGEAIALSAAIGMLRDAGLLPNPQSEPTTYAPDLGAWQTIGTRKAAALHRHLASCGIPSEQHAPFVKYLLGKAVPHLRELTQAEYQTVRRAATVSQPQGVAA